MCADRANARICCGAGVVWCTTTGGAITLSITYRFYRSVDDGPDHETEGTTLDYNAEEKTGVAEFHPPFWASKFNKSQFEWRGVAGDRTNGYWSVFRPRHRSNYASLTNAKPYPPLFARWNEISWPYNTITDAENVTQEALADILGIWDYLKNSGEHPESAKMGLTWVGTVGGKREGRRFVGQYVMQQNDVMSVDRLCTRKPP